MDLDHIQLARFGVLTRLEMAIWPVSLGSFRGVSGGISSGKRADLLDVIEGDTLEAIKTTRNGVCRGIVK